MRGSLLLKYKYENILNYFVSSIVLNVIFFLLIKFKLCGFNAFVLLSFV